MTIHESTVLLRQAEIADLVGLTNTALRRARAIAEFAAIASVGELQDARDAGNLCISQLRDARREILSELMRARKLRDSLAMGCEH